MALLLNRFSRRHDDDDDVIKHRLESFVSFAIPLRDSFESLASKKIRDLSMTSSLVNDY